MADETFRCVKCKRKLPVTAEYWYLRQDGRRNGPRCKACRRKKGRKPPAKCRHCHKPILGRTTQAAYHIDPDHPDCYAAYQAHVLNRQRRYQASAKGQKAQARKKLRKDKRRARGPLCPICHRHRMPDGHTYMCRYCQQDNPDDGDLIYFGELDSEALFY
jgi:hypothetical protein